MAELIVILYFAIGILLMNKWWEEEYSEDYLEALEDGEFPKGMASITMLLLTFLWPIKLAINIFKW